MFKIKNLLTKFVVIAAAIMLSTSAIADDYHPAYLEITQTSHEQFSVTWKLPTKPANTSSILELLWSDDIKLLSSEQGTRINELDIINSRIIHADNLAAASVTVLGLTQVNIDVLVRIEYLNNVVETARLSAKNSAYQFIGKADLISVAKTYTIFGIEHILEGYDHLLFVACLVFIAGSLKNILITITGFTLAHSVTLTLSALELVYLPIAPIEAIIALSIVFLAREIVINNRNTITWRYPIAVSSSFGLLHGFGFASALREIGLPTTDIATALVMFNVGVEIGQVLFVLTLVSAAYLIKQLWQLKPARLASTKHSDPSLAKKTFKFQQCTGLVIGVVTMGWTIERVASFWL
ncbi:MAG: HupE/UreJ family protein [Thalassotalea sp.]